MKIISKYKDFYDYLAQDYSADITYVRKPFFSTDLIEFSKESNIRNPQKRYWSYRYDPDIELGEAIFGIYPYVYTSPYVKIKYRTITLSSEYYIYFFTENDLNSVVTAKNLVDLCKKKLTEYFNSKPNPNIYRMLDKYTYWTSQKNIGEYIKKTYINKIDMKDIFMKFNSPVFCEWNSWYVYTIPYYDLKDIRGKSNRSQDVKWICNCSFDKLGKDILKIWMNDLINVNTYNNIENFLWASKQEPISEPDNKTKIVNHGFDLKTSFRKM